jgi:Mlc titration factor MtfA (ptsG expression regulator)
MLDGEFLALVLVVLIVLYRFRKPLRRGYGFASKRAAPIGSRVLPVPQVYKAILQKYFTYYQNLLPADKARFERKVTNFIWGKLFIPRGVSEVTIEARVLIAAAAVQLTFGLKDVRLTHFSRILVYPNDYYSSITKRYHRGEVNPRFGVIVLSWQSFIDGYITPGDSVNVGLHEMAHALRLENILRSDDHPPYFDPALMKQFDDFGRDFCRQSVINPERFFRPYACTNIEEFFAVAVENFFERSTQFKREFPEIYFIMSRLLNQDPTQVGKKIALKSVLQPPADSRKGSEQQKTVANNR